MEFSLDREKALQATALMLHEFGKSRPVSKLDIMKLLYLAEARSLEEKGRMITGDKICAMKRGPILSHVLDCIRGKVTDWNEFIERPDAIHIRFTKEFDTDQLSPYEIRIIAEIADKYRDWDTEDIEKHTKTYAAYKKNKPGRIGKQSKPIPLRDILEDVGRLKDYDAIVRAAQDEAAMRDFASAWSE